MSLDDTKQECQRVADDEVRGFMELQVHPKVTGREMVKESPYQEALLFCFHIA